MTQNKMQRKNLWSYVKQKTKTHYKIPDLISMRMVSLQKIAHRASKKRLSVITKSNLRLAKGSSLRGTKKGIFCEHRENIDRLENGFFERK